MNEKRPGMGHLKNGVILTLKVFPTFDPHLIIFYQIQIVALQQNCSNEKCFNTHDIN